MNSLRTLPKAELHLHIEGALEPELAFELARRNTLTLPFESVEDLRSRYRFTDLSSFLNVYYAAMAALHSANDFRDLAKAYLDRAHAHGVRHVEMFFDPQVHMQRGVSFDALVDGLRDALAEASDAHRMTGGLIMCVVRDRPVQEAADLIELAATRRDDLLGVGLDSAELGYPPHLFKSSFARARQLGFHLVAHAGEEGGPDYIWSALEDLHVERIDHGIRAVEDLELMSRLQRDQTPLTVCPLSNVRLAYVRGLRDHPLPRLLDGGLRVTVNSDDPAYFDGYIADNFEAVRAALSLTDAQFAQLARNSITASFAPEERRSAILSEIKNWEDGQPPSSEGS